MCRTDGRFRFAGLVVAAVFCCVSTAIGQSASGQSAPASRVEDIRVSETDGDVSILVLLSKQPSAASVVAKADAIVLEIDGVPLAPFSIKPQPGLLLHAITGQPSGDGGAQLIMTGAALEQVEAVIYRNAVLVSGRLAEPPAQPASSLIAQATPSADARTAAVASTDSVSVVAARPEPWRAATLLGLSDARCDEAAASLARDAWDLSALGDEGLCLIRAGDNDGARTRLDQLAAFQPEDTRVALGRSELQALSGEWDEARKTLEIAVVSATDLGAQQILRRALANLPPAQKLD